jgi:hypothetical protein
LRRTRAYGSAAPMDVVNLSQPEPSAPGRLRDPDCSRTETGTVSQSLAEAQLPAGTATGALSPAPRRSASSPMARVASGSIAGTRGRPGDAIAIPEPAQTLEYRPGGAPAPLLLRAPHTSTLIPS